MKCGICVGLPEIGKDEERNEQRYDGCAEADEVDETRYEVVFILQ